MNLTEQEECVIIGNTKEKNDNPLLTDTIKRRKKQIREYNRLYAKKHSEENKEWYKLNKEIVSRQHKEYFQRTKHKRNVKRKWLYQNDIVYRLRHILRARFHGFLKLKNLKKQISVIKLVGCSGEQLQKYLEFKFKNGMTWENYGKFGWHIDHIIPLSSTTNQEDMERLCHYTNLQPLWWYENISKGNKSK